MEVVDHPLFLRRRHRRRELFPRLPALPVWTTGGPATRQARLLRRVHRYGHQWDSADPRLAPAAALLAHADRVEHGEPDVQVLGANVDRLLGTAAVRTVRGAGGARRGARGRARTLGACLRSPKWVQNGRGHRRWRPRVLLR